MEDHQEEKKAVIGYLVAKEEQPLLPISTRTPTVPGDTDSSSCHREKPEMKGEDGSVIAVVVTVLFACGLIAIILRTFKFRPPEFEIDQLVVSPFNISSSSSPSYYYYYLTTNWVVSFSVSNPPNTDEGTYCENVTASVFYEDEKISTAPVEPFFLYRDHKISVPVNTGVSTAYINGSVGDDIIADWASGAASFTVIMNSTARISAWDNKENLTVSCEDIKVVFSSDMKNAGTILVEDHQEGKKTVIGYLINMKQQTFLPISTPTTAVLPADDDSLSCRSRKTESKDKDNGSACALGLAILLFCGVYILAVVTSRPPEFVIDHLFVSPFNVSSSSSSYYYLSANRVFSSTDRNTDKGINCENTTASVLHKDEKISTASLESFTTHDHWTLVPVNIGISTASINVSVGDAIVSDWTSGAVDITVTMGSMAKINNWDGKEKMRQMTVRCEHIMVSFSSNMKYAGTMLGKPRTGKALYI